MRRILFFIFVISVLTTTRASDEAHGVVDTRGDETIRAAELLKDGNPTQHAAGLKELRRLADSGYAPAMHLIALSLIEGSYGATKDEVAAYELLKRSAELEYVPAMVTLSFCYATGGGTLENHKLAFKWATKASRFSSPSAWATLGTLYEHGVGTPVDMVEAVKWYKKAAGAGEKLGLFSYACCLTEGRGVEKNESLAFVYFRAAALQMMAEAQYSTGIAFLKGHGVVKSMVDGLAWMSIAAKSGNSEAMDFMAKTHSLQIPPALKRDIDAKVRSILAEIEATPQRRDGPEPWSSPKLNPGADLPGSVIKSTGSGFVITSQGHVITNHHVAPASSKVKVITRFGAFSATVIRTDEQLDLSLLKIDGEYIPLPILRSSRVRLGSTVATIGFPNTEIQGYSPKLSKGEISSLSGLQDEPRCFQVSTPLQPGNSGGPLFDEMGNVVGVVSFKINQQAAIRATGTIAENVGYAVKSDYLLAFLESSPEVLRALVEPRKQSMKFEDTVAEVEKSAVLILVY